MYVCRCMSVCLYVCEVSISHSHSREVRFMVARPASAAIPVGTTSQASVRPKISWWFRVQGLGFRAKVRAEGLGFRV